MKTPNSPKEKLVFWENKLKEYQKTYQKLKTTESKDWWHNEGIDNQMRVWENLIISIKLKIAELKKELLKSSHPKPTA